MELREVLARFRERPGQAAAFLLVAAVALFFGVHAALDALDWRHGPRQIRPWMTVGVVGRMHRLDPRVIDAAGGFPSPDPEPWTIREIAESRGVPPHEVIAEIEATIAGLRGDEAPE